MAEIKILRPAFYDEFVCKANTCRNTCCQGWYIALGKRDYCKMKNAVRGTKLEKDFSEAVRRTRGDDARKFYAEIITSGETKTCKYLTENGLCDFYLTCGGKDMPDVCKIYPRKMILNKNIFYKSLSPTCEAVVEYIFKLKDGIDFILDHLNNSTDIYRKDHALTEFLFKIGNNNDLFTVYNLLVDIMQNRAFSIEERLLFIGLAFKSLPENFNEEFDYSAWGEKYGIFSDKNCQNILGNIETDENKFVLNISKTLGYLQKLYNKDSEFVKDIYEFLEYKEKPSENNDNEFTISFNLDKYQYGKAKFDKVFKDKQYVWENYLILAFLDILTNNEIDKLYTSYEIMCYCLGIVKMYLISHCDELESEERIIDLISFVSRTTLHSVFVGTCAYVHDTLNDGSLASLANVIYH